MSELGNVMLAGATGLTGQHLLPLLMQDATVSRVVAPTRRPLQPDAKLENPVGDLEDTLPAIHTAVRTAFCCLGTTIKQAGSREAFRSVDHDLVVRFAVRARALGAEHMLVISALGANPSSMVFYNKVKGEMEQALRDQDWPRLTIVRPSLLLGPRAEFRLGEKLSAPLMRLVPGKYRGIEVSVLAKAMLRLAKSDASGARVVESAELRRLGAIDGST